MQRYFSSFVGREYKINHRSIWADPPQLDSFEQHTAAKKASSLKTYENPEEVTYEYNSFGFRTPEFEPGQCVDLLTLGCSFTEGIGLKYEDIWDKQLASLLGVKSHISLGSGGAGLETISRYLAVAINQIKLKPKIIYIVFPDILRTEGFTNDLDFNRPIFNYLPQEPFFKCHEGYTDSWHAYINALNVKNRFYALIQQVIMCANLSKACGAKFIWDTWAPFVAIFGGQDNSKVTKELRKVEENMFHDQFGLNVFRILNRIAPQQVKDTILSPYHTWITNDAYIPKPYRTNPAEIARDFAHPGPNCHSFYAKSAFELIKNRI